MLIVLDCYWLPLIVANLQSIDNKGFAECEVSQIYILRLFWISVNIRKSLENSVSPLLQHHGPAPHDILVYIHSQEWLQIDIS